MALRARALTAGNLENLVGNENPVGKQFIQPAAAHRPQRAALGDIRNVKETSEPHAAQHDLSLIQYGI